ncbi:hypothetical protein HKD37_18G049882 [Glycine soja]
MKRRADGFIGNRDAPGAPPLVEVPARLPLVVAPGAPPLLVVPGVLPLLVAPDRQARPPLSHRPVQSRHVSRSGGTLSSGRRFVVKK